MAKQRQPARPNLSLFHLQLASIKTMVLNSQGWLHSKSTKWKGLGLTGISTHCNENHIYFCRVIGQFWQGRLGGIRASGKAHSQGQLSARFYLPPTLAGSSGRHSRFEARFEKAPFRRSTRLLSNRVSESCRPSPQHANWVAWVDCFFVNLMDPWKTLDNYAQMLGWTKYTHPPPSMRIRGSIPSPMKGLVQLRLRYELIAPLGADCAIVPRRSCVKQVERARITGCDSVTCVTSVPVRVHVGM